MQGDVDSFDSIAEESGWSDLEAQVMLRALGCDPGPIDGVVEDLTTAATRNFQVDYNGNVFHRHTPLRPRHRPLPLDGVLGGPTLSALRESYVLAYSPRVPEDQFVAERAAVGCGEFNLLADDEGCAFQVYRTKPMESPDDVVEANLADPLSGDLSGIVKGGVAQVVWIPPEGFFDDAGYEIEARRVLWRPPVFRVVGGGTTAVSQPWEFEVDRAELEEGADAAVVLDAFGRLQLHVLDGVRVLEERSISEPRLAQWTTRAVHAESMVDVFDDDER